MPDPASPLLAFSQDLAGLVARTAPSIVAVHSHRHRASGFAWKSGLIVTADEALAEEGAITVHTADGATVAATLAGRDPSTDIALLRIGRSDLPPAPLDPGPVAAGSLAVAVGAEEGAPTVALGLVSRAGPAWRSLRGGEIDARIELDLALRRSGEGGLALDPAGRAIGMVVFGPRRRALVIPAATIGRVAPHLESSGRIPLGYLGLGLQAVRREDGSTGLMVMSVEPGGPGAQAGLRQGDMITAWNGQPIRGLGMLQAALGPGSPGSTVTLAISRGGAPLEVALTIGERP
ncbi:S1C family serine protease [Methylobacterium nodulans]|uniref:PDZ/DHR/GLGF domain protein n=1 Tax=Methylobacterium nodulans (strain LMG 21967 / CNCM I-2342 / ORS 2060) TaxID=460265 RepID=B8ICC8_METNO|nr:S1C family serine protease [Methylobacterium nodulans]ACL55516.1 PDZ/DHR/GLGF domain protein [Methylobacterium nodulans ORS 2060]